MHIYIYTPLSLYIYIYIYINIYIYIYICIYIYIYIHTHGYVHKLEDQMDSMLLGPWQSSSTAASSLDIRFQIRKGG